MPFFRRGIDLPDQLSGRVMFSCNHTEQSQWAQPWPPELRQKFMANMSQRAAELFSEDMEASGPVRLSEVEAQQRKILDVARDLAASGDITLGDKPDDAYV